MRTMLRPICLATRELHNDRCCGHTRGPPISEYPPLVPLEAVGYSEASVVEGEAIMVQQPSGNGFFTIYKPEDFCHVIVLISLLEKLGIVHRDYIMIPHMETKMGLNGY